MIRYTLPKFLFLILCVPFAFAFHTNQFAVKILGSANEANDIAAKYGFTNKGQIGSLEGYYLFEKHGISKRSLEPSPFHTSLLLNDSSVDWCEQQVSKTRVKRSPNVFNFSDPLYSEQWFLHDDKNGYDMNIRPAWQKGYTGKGVVVCIIDDGLQGNHPDLELNYDKEASYDLNGNDDDPSPADDDENNHGTRCAGLVAAVANNKFCGVGVAYNAKVGGVRMLDGGVTDIMEATAYGFKPNYIHIYSASWGPKDDGKTVDGPGNLAKLAFENGVKKGRNGLGSIYVWAAGNGGRQNDNCNCDGYTNSIYTISIGSATGSGYRPWYLEKCSSTLATTYSSGTSADRKITTTDVDYTFLGQENRLANPAKLCTKQHTGTSASAPIAAGMCALALEANPNLTWRDIQYIIVLTSRSIPLNKEEGWITNGAGRNVSCKFGYGLMDGYAMVQVASKWKTLAPQHICSTQPNTAIQIIPKTKGHSMETTMFTDGCVNTDNTVRYAEHVQVIVTLQFYPRGSLQIMLVSPSNTTSTLLFPRSKDDMKERDSFVDWPFLSVYFWGEEIYGTWKLIILNAGTTNSDEAGNLRNWSIIFYGTEDLPDCVKSDNCADYKEQENRHAEHAHPIRDIRRVVEKCHDKCGTCHGPLSNQCTSCIPPLRLHEQFHTCLPCCDGVVSKECCICSNKLDECLMHDNINGVNLGVNLPQSDSNPQDYYPKKLFTFATIVFFIFMMMCLVLSCLVKNIYPLGHAGINGKKYVPVPRDGNAKFNSDQEKGFLTEVDTEDDVIYVKT